MRNILSIKKQDKKGATAVKGVVGVIIGLVIVIVLLTAVAPTMFSGSNSISGAPTWFNTVYPLIIAAAVILLLWRAMS